MKKYDLYKFDTMTVEEFRADSNNIMANGDSESGNAIANSALSKRGFNMYGVQMVLIHLTAVV
ncbi:MAG: hypothetical protein ACLTMR_00405 [Faecalibacillus sp.]